MNINSFGNQYLRSRRDDPRMVSVTDDDVRKFIDKKGLSDEEARKLWTRHFLKNPSEIVVAERAPVERTPPMNHERKLVMTALTETLYALIGKDYSADNDKILSIERMKDAKNPEDPEQYLQSIGYKGRVINVERIYDYVPNGTTDVLLDADTVTNLMESFKLSRSDAETVARLMIMSRDHVERGFQEAKRNAMIILTEEMKERAVETFQKVFDEHWDIQDGRLIQKQLRA